jgi:hypothetical protein
MVDAPASGAGVCMDVEVRVLFWAPIIIHKSLIFMDKLACYAGTFRHFFRQLDFFDSVVPQPTAVA